MRINSISGDAIANDIITALTRFGWFFCGRASVELRVPRFCDSPSRSLCSPDERVPGSVVDLAFPDPHDGATSLDSEEKHGPG
jgi:hypothetical protein